jgi:hypothetical protein
MNIKTKNKDIFLLWILRQEQDRFAFVNIKTQTMSLSFYED